MFPALNTVIPFPRARFGAMSLDSVPGASAGAPQPSPELLAPHFPKVSFPSIDQFLFLRMIGETVLRTISKSGKRMLTPALRGTRLCMLDATALLLL